MFFYLYKIIKSITLPPGIFVGIFFIIAFKSKKVWIRLMSLLSGVALYILSTHAGSYILAGFIHTNGGARPVSCDIITVFGAGVSYESIFRLYKGCSFGKIYGCPIAITGYKPETRFMLSFAEEISCNVKEIDSLSRNTVENINFVKNLWNSGYRNIVIISSDYHTKRIRMLLKRRGLNLSVAGVSVDGFEDPVLKWFPSYEKFYENMKYLNEIVATVVLSVSPM